MPDQTWVPRTYHWLTERRFSRMTVYLAIPLASMALTQFVLPWLKGLGH